MQLTDDRYWKNVTPAAKEFVKSCLTVDPKKRITADEAMKHAVRHVGCERWECSADTLLISCLQWLTEHKADTEASHDLSIGLRDNYRARWKTAINAVRASTKFRTFAALAADKSESEQDSDVPDAKTALPAKGKITPPTRSELYSDHSTDDSNNGEDEYTTGDEEDSEEGSKSNSKDGERKQKSSAMSNLTETMSNISTQ